MGSSSAGQSREVTALTTATNRTSMLIPAAEVSALAVSLGCASARRLQGSPEPGWILLQLQQLRLGRNAACSPGTEPPQSIYPELASGDVFVYPAHPFAFAALLFHLRSAC